MTGRAFLPGQVLVRLAPGHELVHVPAHRDVRLRAAAAAERLDGNGPLDQRLRRHTGAIRATCAFTSRRNVSRPAARHLGWDDLEAELGLSRTYRVAVDRAARIQALVGDLAEAPGVELATPAYLCRTPFSAVAPDPAPGAPLDDARSLVGALTALELEPGDSTLIVATIDSGAAPLHPELLGRLRPGLNTVTATELEPGLQLVSGPRPRGQDIGDDQGHGTAVAGILGANGLGVPPGLAGAAEILAIRALCGARLQGENHATAIGSLADIDSGLKSAVDLGARILNLSFGTPASDLGPDDPVPHVAVVRYAAARECVLVSASGNSGADEPYFPAALPGVIAVASVGLDRRRSGFSTGGRHVALCAPGEDLRVAALGGYGRMSGTSFAAPLVAGACALMLARANRLSTPLGAGDIKELLQRSAAPFAAGDAHTTSESCGAGILDVPAALRAVEERCRAEAA